MTSHKPMEATRIAYQKNANGSYTFYYWSQSGTLLEKQTYVGYLFYQAKESFTNLIKTTNR